MAHRLGRGIRSARGGPGATGLGSGWLRQGSFVAGIPSGAKANAVQLTSSAGGDARTTAGQEAGATGSYAFIFPKLNRIGAKARIDYVGFMYGLKLVPFGGASFSLAWVEGECL